MGDQLLAGRSKDPVILHVHTVEWRHVHLFSRVIFLGRDAGPLIGSAEPVVVCLAKGVVHFGEHHFELPGHVVEIKKRDGIEHISEIAQMGQQENLSAGNLNSFSCRILF